MPDQPSRAEIISIGSQPEFASALDNGLKMATSDMVRWLTKDYGLEPWAAHLFVGYQGKYDVVTVAGQRTFSFDGHSCSGRGTGWHCYGFSHHPSVPFVCHANHHS